jgi:hypothetical protein
MTLNGNGAITATAAMSAALTSTRLAAIRGGGSGGCASG